MIERLLASTANKVLALALFGYLVALPLCGVTVPTGAELIGGNYTNIIGYLAASIAAGASVTNLAEGRRHRRSLTDRLDALHHHLTGAPPPEENPHE